MKKTILVISIVLNLIVGYLFFKTFVWQAGFVAGQTRTTQEVNDLINQGKLLITTDESKN